VLGQEVTLAGGQHAIARPFHPRRGQPLGTLGTGAGYGAALWAYLGGDLLDYGESGTGTPVEHAAARSACRPPARHDHVVAQDRVVDRVPRANIERRGLKLLLAVAARTFSPHRQSGRLLTPEEPDRGL